MDAPRVRLGELLVKSGLISEERLGEALSVQREDGRRLGTLLVELGLVTEIQVTQVLSQQLSVPWVSLHHIDFSRQLLTLVPHDIVARYCLIPIYVRRVRGLGDTLYVAMDDPTNEKALEEVAAVSSLHVRAMIAPPSDILAAIRAYYGQATEPDEDDVVTGVRERPKVSPPPKPRAADRVSGEHPRATARSESAAGRGNAAGVAVAAEQVPLEAREAVAIASKPAPPKPAREPSKGPMVSLTLLDGTTIQVPIRKGERRANAEPEEQVTSRDLVAALRAAVRGADASDVLGREARWESMVAALLAVLLKKHLIADWEFIEELKKG